MPIQTPPYFKWRACAQGGGRPRWEPGPGLRAKGWPGRDLKDDAGNWLGLEAAIATAEHINADVAEWRRTGRRPNRADEVRRTAPAHTCRALVDRWLASVHAEDHARATLRDYRNKANIWLAEFGDAPVRSVTKPVMYAFWEELYRDRGHAMANGVLAVARAALSHAERIGWRPPQSNPAFHLGLKSVPPRVVVWTPAEVLHLVRTADGMGHAGVGDAVVIALHSGQRQGDVLALEQAETDDARVALRQSKTGALVRVPSTEQLTARFASIRARRRAGGVVTLAAASGLGHLVLHPGTGQPYRSDTFRHDFAAVRAAAVEALRARGEETAGAALGAKWFSDLRDTAITRLALASCTIPEIRAITGHSLETVHGVLKHYLALDEASARAGIERLEIWMKREGIAL